MNALARIEEALAGLSDDETAALDEIISKELALPWMPTPGPQLEAFVSEADLLLYGGAAGGGKTDLLCGLALTEHQNTVVFRRLAADLKGFWKRLTELCTDPVQKNDNDKTMTTADGRHIECGHLDAPGSEMSWQGRPHDLIAFDEGAQLTAYKVKFVLGWNRSASGHRCRAVIASNPPLGADGAWLVEWFAPWLDPLFPNRALPGELRWAVTVGNEGEIRTIWVDGPGHVVLEENGFRSATEEEIEDRNRTDVVKPMSRTFIPSKLDDNPYLKDDYRATLQNLPEPLKSQLLHGDFLAGKQDHKWQVIPTAWIDSAQARWKPEKPPGVPMTTIGVDVAQGGPDNTVLAPLYGVWFDKLKVHKGIDTKDGPAVSGLVVAEMRDGCHVNIDLTGGWGISARDHLVKNKIKVNGIVFSAGSDARTRDGKFGFFNLRAELFWQFREALDPYNGFNVALPPSEKLKAQLAAPHWKLRGDKIVIESKEEIKKRLGSSTDEADAVIEAWHKRELAIFVREQSDNWGSWSSTPDDYDPLDGF